MFILGNFLITLAHIIVFLSEKVISIFVIVIIARALISWVNPDPYNVIVQVLHRITEPVLDPIRYWLVRIFKRELVIDFSPIVAIILLNILQIFLSSFVASNLYKLGSGLQ